MKRFNAYGILCQRAGLRWLIACLLPVCTTSAASRNWLYERDIAPILRTYCAGCHNDADREGEFSVETFASLNKGGDKGATLKPGDPESSLLVKLIEGRSKPLMPPKDEPRVPAAELALLRQWIADGAPGPQRDESLLKNLVVPEVATGRGVARPWTAVEYSPDGKILALGTAGRVEFRNASGRRIQRVIDGIPGKVNALHFSADGATLVVAAGITGIDGVAQLHSVATGQKLVRFEGHRDAVQDAEL